ncbi:MAG TPA: hypothetical protein VM261_38295 [Kofleriaceae bacterium]|nr:hypothetical protein [Kofleriaceae bacterium]
MSSGGFAALAVVLVALPMTAAHADEMSLGVGFGGGAGLGGDLDRAFSANGEVGGRILLGWRRASTQIEASFFGTDVHLASSPMSGTHSTLALGLGLKQYVAVVPHVELYARGALDYTWLAPFPDDAPPMGYAGRGFDYGAGVELGWRTRVPASRGTRIASVGVLVWLDAGRQHVRLTSDDGKPLRGTVDQGNLGVSFTTAW